MTKPILFSLILVVALPFGNVHASEEHFIFRIDADVQDKVAELGDKLVEELPVPILFGVALGDFPDSWGHSRSGGRVHTGTDIRAPRGEVIVSPTDAVVTKIGYDDLGGHFVITANPGGEQFYYAHLDRIALGLWEGQVLELGDMIGTVGITGNTGGTSHLHFEIYREGRSVNSFPRLTREFTIQERIVALEKMIQRVKVARR